MHGCRPATQPLLRSRIMITMLDLLLDHEPGRSATAVRHIPQTLDVFTTHFPRFPVLPGVLILEDAVEVARIAVSTFADRPMAGRTWNLASARRLRFRHFVQPGDSMEISATVTELTDQSARCRVIIRVAGRAVADIGELALLRAFDGTES